MCDEAAADSLAALKLIPEGFVESEMVKNLYTAFYASEDFWRINGNTVVSQKMAGLMLSSKWKKRNRTDFYPFNVYNTRVFCKYLVTWYSLKIFVNKSFPFSFIFCLY